LRRFFAAPFVAALLLLTFAGQAAAQTDARQKASAEYVPNELLVVFKEAPEGIIRGIIERERGTIVRITSISKLYQLRFPDDVSVDDLVKRFTAIEEVRQVSPNYYFELFVTPNAPLLSEQYYLDNTGAPVAGTQGVAANCSAFNFYDVPLGTMFSYAVVIDNLGIGGSEVGPWIS